MYREGRNVSLSAVRAAPSVHTEDSGVTYHQAGRIFFLDRTFYCLTPDQRCAVVPDGVLIVREGEYRDHWLPDRLFPSWRIDYVELARQE